MLQQALDRLKAPSSRVSVSASPRVSASELTPSLVALDDAATLKRKEFEKDKLAIEKPHVFSTKEGRLTPTASVYEDMRTATPFHVTTVESQEGLSVAEGGEEIGRVTQKLPDPIDESESRKVPPVSVASRPDEIEERTCQKDMTGKNAISKASSREDALATTRRFFGNDTEVKSVPEVPVTTMSVLQTDTPPTDSALVVERPEPSPVRTIPYSGTPSRPTATTTLRPRMLVQRRSEGQVETQPQDDTSSDSDTLEPLVMEGLPDELGPEWRILHPFDIPGVRNPTEHTPPTHRRLAKNDTLVELIQTAEYLEDVPSWEQRRFYPPRYGDPFFRGCGRGRSRGRGRGWLQEDIPGRNVNGRGRFQSHGHEREGFPSRRDVGRDIRLELPPEPRPARHSDWSSASSPPARTFPHGTPGILTELSGNVQDQLNAPTTVTTRSERFDVGNVDIALQTEPVREDQEVHAILVNNLEQNEENMDIIPPAPVRSAPFVSSCR